MQTKFRIAQVKEYNGLVMNGRHPHCTVFVRGLGILRQNGWVVYGTENGKVVSARLYDNKKEAELHLRQYKIEG